MVSLVLYQCDWSIRSIIIALWTRSRYTHSAIQVGDRIFEASGDRDKIGWSDANTYEGRKSRHIELDISRGHAIEILSKYEGKEFDHKAMRYWVLSLHSEDKLYCFQLSWQFLMEAGKVDHYPKKVTAKTLLEVS